MKKYKVYQVDAFTREKFRGNPAGVVSDAQGLTVEHMQDIAREMNCSETAFILPSESQDHDLWIRYFTPTTEVPVCGHATIAAHYVRAKEQNFTHPIQVRTRTGAGVLPVDITPEGNEYKVIMTQGAIEFGDILEDSNKSTLLSALDVAPDELDSRCPIQIVSTGHSKVMIGIRERKKLNKIAPNLEILRQLSKKINCNGYFVFTFDTGDNDVLTTGRMFAPAIGINEDPVTGNANGPLGAYLVHHERVEYEEGTFQFKGKQGEAIRRPGIVEVTVHVKDKKPQKVQVGGNAVIIFETKIQV
jgi:PhzF family phenazine biosynthesis protein